MKKGILIVILVVSIIAVIFIVSKSCQKQNLQAQSSPTEQSSVSKNFIENDNLALGNPSNAKPDVASEDNYLIEKPEYTISYSNSRHIPNWVGWHITSTDIGNSGRHDSFRADTTLPKGYFEVTPADYAKSGFDKGHMCPSADRTETEEHNRATFLMTNMVPQAPNNNRIVWESLESYSRKLVEAGNELYIVAGSYGQGGTGSKGKALTIKDGVVVPAYTWKVVVVLPEGKDDLKRISSTTRVIAVLMPNTQSCSTKTWEDYRISVDSLESFTHYDFLTKVSASIQKIIEARVDEVNP